MKIKKITNQKTLKTTTALLKEICVSSDRNGSEHVYINCSDNESFSNFMSVWEKQNISVEDLEPGDKLEIQYVEKEWNGKMYKNFYKVTFIERPTLIQKLKNLAPSLSSTSSSTSTPTMEDIVDEVLNENPEKDW